MSKKLKKMHAVMMEYVIVAVLIAAAVVVAVLVFGRTVKSEFNVATTSMVDADKAERQQGDIQKNVDANNQTASDHAKAMNNYNTQDVDK